MRFPPREVCSAALLAQALACSFLLRPDHGQEHALTCATLFVLQESLSSPGLEHRTLLTHVVCTPSAPAPSREVALAELSLLSHSSVLILSLSSFLSDSCPRGMLSSPSSISFFVYGDIYYHDSLLSLLAGFFTSFFSADGTSAFLSPIFLPISVSAKSRVLWVLGTNSVAFCSDPFPSSEG